MVYSNLKRFELSTTFKINQMKIFLKKNIAIFEKFSILNWKKIFIGKNIFMLYSKLKSAGQMYDTLSCKLLS